MSKFETSLSKTISLDAKNFNRQNFPKANESHIENRSTKNDIFRYSYNLGKHRVARIQRTASVGGNLLQPMDGSLARILLGRKGITRSMSLGSHIGLKPNNEAEDKNCNDLPLGARGELVSDASPSLINETNEFEKTPEKEIENQAETENTSAVRNLPDKSAIIANSDKNIAEVKNVPDALIKKTHGFSDSVPDLRSTGNSESKLPRESFSSSFSHSIDVRPICKLRRAARRLGVSLSSEELYHKQRRNGVCNEIDDAAENRKLLRVLNKRF